VRRKFFEVAAAASALNQSHAASDALLLPRCTLHPTCPSLADFTTTALTSLTLPPTSVQVFYRCHIVCFLGFTLFAYIHYFWSWTYFLPGDATAA
jgi:hypothetical protein